MINGVNTISSSYLGPIETFQCVLLTFTLLVGFEETGVDEFQVSKDATIVVKLLLPRGQQKGSGHKTAHQERCAADVDILPVHGIQQGANRTTAGKAHGVRGGWMIRREE